MKQCFGYIRVSTVKQGEGVSLEAQREAIEAFARRENIAISEWFEEKETAAKSGRPVFNAMVRALKQGRAHGMVIHRIDRSSRNLKDWATISDLSDSGIDVHFATESLDFRSRGGRLTADIQAVIAADYIRNLSIESRKGINGRLKQGLYPWPAPLGYLNNGGGKPKLLDPIRAPLVKELFRLYLTGDHSIRTLHMTMVDAGLTTKSGRPVSKHTVEHILGNPFYCGLTKNGRTGEVFAGVHEELITQKQFERVQVIKEGRYVKKATRHNHLHRRLFHCSRCHRVLSPERQKGHIYYRCHTTECPSKTVREEHLDEAVLNALIMYQIPSSDDDVIETRYQTWRAQHGFQTELKSVDLRIRAAEARLDRLTDLFIDGKFDEFTCSQKRERLLFEINALKDERKDIENRAASDRDRRKFLELMKSLALLYMSANTAEKRVLIENCFSNRRWNGQSVELEPSNLVIEARDGLCVPYGGPIRDTIRTLIRKLDNPDTEQNFDNAA